MIKKPMLAETVKVFEELKYPLFATPKIDGIRCLVIDGKALSRKFKPIPNHYIRNKIEAHCPTNFDGEVIIPGLPLNRVNSAVMSRDGEPKFEYWVFDYAPFSLDEPYHYRMKRLISVFGPRPEDQPDFVKLVTPVPICNADELRVFEEQCIQLGFEGVMTRDPQGRYKCGRSTLKEQLLLKIKRWEDSEAEIIGFQEKLKNDNVVSKDALGHAKRSKHKDGLVPSGTLGAFLVRDMVTGIEFACGSGLDAEFAQEVWNERESYLGKLITYKFIPYGIKEKPKNPIFKAIRHPDDMGE